jgi:Methyltransferase FkbM domain
LERLRGYQAANDKETEMASVIPKFVFADRAQSIRILRGPFRGAIVVMNPRNSLRKVFGLYEHELNPWIKRVLPRVTKVLDVGANDGYFTFGCAAAFRRFGKTGSIMAFEPQQQHMDTLKQSISKQPAGPTRITLVQKLVGNEVRPGTTTLDEVRWDSGGDPKCRSHTLVKIDVEGAELEVLKGGSSWLKPTNFFVIEVHDELFLERIARLFAANGLRLLRIDQRPLAVLGREMRSEKNWWLASDLPGLHS